MWWFLVYECFLNAINNIVILYRNVLYQYDQIFMERDSKNNNCSPIQMQKVLKWLTLVHHMKFDISLWANVFLCMDGVFGRKQKSKLQFIVQIYKKSRRIFFQWWNYNFNIIFLRFGFYFQIVVFYLVFIMWQQWSTVEFLREQTNTWKSYTYLNWSKQQVRWL